MSRRSVSIAGVRSLARCRPRCERFFRGLRRRLTSEGNFRRISLRSKMRAIDVHVHVPEPRGDPGAEERRQVASYFRASSLPQSPDEMYEKYKSLDLMGVIFSIDA